MNLDQQRKEAERQFHNERFGSEHDSREPLGKWYEAIKAGGALQTETVRALSQGRDVLEYGCADGCLSLDGDFLAEGARSFHGIDISDKAIEKANAKAAARGLTHCSFSVMDAEHMTFRDDSFDLVYGRGIIHHLDLSRCLPEVARVLRPGGKAIFYEPMGHNPLINGFRKKTPHLRTHDEHPLLMRDIRLAEQIFSKVECRFFGFTTLAAVPFRDTALGKPLMKLLEEVDDILLRLPLIRQNAWHVMITLTK